MRLLIISKHIPKPDKNSNNANILQKTNNNDENNTEFEGLISNNSKELNCRTQIYKNAKKCHRAARVC